MKQQTRRERTTANLARMAEDMGLGATEVIAPSRRAELFRVAGAVANVLDTELKRQSLGKSGDCVTRRMTMTGSQVVVLSLAGVKYNLTITRARS